MDKVQKDVRVKYSLGRNIQTKFIGVVQKRTRRFVWVVPERVSGRFIKRDQKCLLCIKRKYVEAL